MPRLKGLAALACATAVAATAACGSRPGGAESAAPDDRVVIGTANEVVRLDPAGSYDMGSWQVGYGLYQSLLRFAPGDALPTPDAAESCDWVNGSRTAYACKLRSGLTFSNGHKLTSSDVKHSVDRVLAIKHPSGPSSLLAGIDTVRTDGARRIVFTLKAPDATFPSKLATGAGAVVDEQVYPDDELLPDAEAVGSGLYTLDSLTRAGVVLAPNSAYRGPSELRNKGVELRAYSDPAKAKQALDRGTVDVIDRVGPEQVGQLREAQADSAGTRLYEGPGTQTNQLAFNTRRPALGKAAVRRAAATLINPEEIASRVYRGTVDPLYSLIPQGLAGHATPYFDRYHAGGTEQAERLLREAGVHTPVAFTLTWSGTEASGEQAELIAKQLEDGGLFRVRVRELEWPDFLKRQAAGELDAYPVSWVPDYPDADNFTAALLVDGGAFHTGWNDPRITDRLIPETMAETDRKVSAADFETIHETAAEAAPLIPIWQSRQLLAARDTVSGLNSTLDTANILRYWLFTKDS